MKNVNRNFQSIVVTTTLIVFLVTQNVEGIIFCPWRLQTCSRQLLAVLKRCPFATSEATELQKYIDGQVDQELFFGILKCPDRLRVCQRSVVEFTCGAPTAAPRSVAPTSSCISSAIELTGAIASVNGNTAAPPSFFLCGRTVQNPIQLTSEISFGGKSFSLGCASSTGQCGITGNNTTRLFLGSPFEVSFNGISFRRGLASPIATSLGGAFYITGGTVSFTNCTFRDNIASRGGAIYATGATTSIQIIRSSFISNRAVRVRKKTKQRMSGFS
jgi:predicted outer membrane repeat protein